MSDAAPSFQPAGFAGQSANGTLTPERIERALADLRDWLNDPPSAESLHVPPPNPIDLNALVGQFVALRHEVNLQTKASRASLEQNAETLRKLDEAVQQLQEQPNTEVPQPEEDEEEGYPDPRPLLKALIDVYDALAFSLQQVERQKAAICAGLETVLQVAEVESPPQVANVAPARPGFWKRLFGASAANDADNSFERWRERFIQNGRERETKVRQAVDFLNQALDGLITGYSMSLNRVDRVLPQFGLDRIPCEGEHFDPELMEVIEVVTGSSRSPGEVIEEVRRGYLLDNAIFRYAQVKVAK